MPQNCSLLPTVKGSNCEGTNLNTGFLSLDWPLRGPNHGLAVLTAGHAERWNFSFLATVSHIQSALCSQSWDMWNTSMDCAEV